MCPLKLKLPWPFVCADDPLMDFWDKVLDTDASPAGEVVLFETEPLRPTLSSNAFNSSCDNVCF